MGGAVPAFFATMRPLALSSKRVQHRAKPLEGRVPLREGESEAARECRSDIDTLCNTQCIFQFDTKVADYTVHLGVTKQKLDRTEVARLRAALSQRRAKCGHTKHLLK